MDGNLSEKQIIYRLWSADQSLFFCPDPDPRGRLPLIVLLKSQERKEGVASFWSVDGKSVRAVIRIRPSLWALIGHEAPRLSWRFVADQRAEWGPWRGCRGLHTFW